MRGKSLALQVKDFILLTLTQNTNDVRREIVIPYSKLAEHLNKAEERLHGMISSQRIPELLRPGVIKRKREQTPPEEPGSEDERLYQLEESKEESRAEV